MNLCPLSKKISRKVAKNAKKKLLKIFAPLRENPFWLWLVQVRKMIGALNLPIFPHGSTPPLSELMSQFVNSNGRLWVCGACAKPRGISEADLVTGATIIGAATAIEALVNGAKSLSF